MHCKESTFCNRSSGQCDEGCKNGWHDMDCTQQCVGHCRDGSYCNQMTGQCDAGCGAGWTGVFCEKGRVLSVYKDLYFSVSDYYHIVHSDLPTWWLIFYSSQKLKNLAEDFNRIQKRIIGLHRTKF